MAWVLFDSFIRDQENGNAIDLEINALLTLALITSTLTPVKATHDFWSDLSANEVAGTNYAEKVLVNPTIGLATGTVKFDADDPAAYLQNAAGFSNGRHAVLYEDNAGAQTTQKLIAYNDFGADKGNVAGDLTLQFDASNGIFTKTSA